MEKRTFRLIVIRFAKVEQLAVCLSIGKTKMMWLYDYSVSPPTTSVDLSKEKIHGEEIFA